MRTGRELLAQSLVVGFESHEPDQFIEELITRHGIGGVILFARNLASPEQVWQLNHNLQQMARLAHRPPLFIMVDQEGGSVARLRAPFTHQPDLCLLGAASPQTLFDHGLQMGTELVAAGFNWNLAPVMDVHGREDGIMARRSLGAAPELVGQLALAYSQGLKQAGCLACAKHFPGLGRTSLDTHKLGVMVEFGLAELEHMELIPFTMAIHAGIAGIMVSHATFRTLDPANPASCSPLVIDGLLRKSLGYQGLVLSDDLEMGAVGMPPAQAALAAYQAGSDLLLICRQSHEALPALEMLCRHLQDGRISEGRLWLSHERIQKTRAQLPAMGELSGLEKILKK